MADVDLQSRFPELQPIKRSPTLQLINGCGLALYGRRDHDEETGTYIKTHCLCIVFLPVLALGSYRVADAANGGWYILGREPLSAFARLWNTMVLLAALSAGALAGWESYTKSPGYIASRRMADADYLAGRKQLGQAADLYRQVATGSTKHASEASAKFKDLLGAALDQAPLAEAAGVLKVARLPGGPIAPDDLYKRGMAVMARHASDDPKGALALIEVVAPLVPEKEKDALKTTRRNLLERIVAGPPADPALASQLAELYEADDEADKCKALLMPMRDKLGLTEGARILGHLLAREGNIEEAHALLVPYTEGRLKQLHDAEQGLDNAYKAAQERVIQGLRTGKATDFDYAAYTQAGEDVKQNQLNEYLLPRIKDAPEIKAASEAVQREARVVPVALDLGVVLLQRAQGMTDPAARRAELEKAEKTFLAVRRLAGESDAYRLNLGQVDYWLGKHEEGRTLFNELIEEKKRAPMLLVGVAGVLREVGADSEARPLLEEAFEKETDAEKKSGVAIQRGIIAKDVDDQIVWYRRAGQDQTGVKAMLASALARKAMEESKESEAIGHIRREIEYYGKMPVSTSTLNNTAVAYSMLSSLTADPGDFDRAAEMFEKAVALDPSNSVLIINSANPILQGALRGIIGDAIDLKMLKRSGSLDLLPFLYRDQAGRRAIEAKLRDDPGVARALALFEKAMLLAPKRDEPYEKLAAIYEFRNDVEKLRGLLGRLEAVDLDLADETAQALDFYAGKRDEKTRADLAAALPRIEAHYAAAKAGPGGPTLAVSALDLVRVRTSGESVGQPADPDEVVTLAEEALAAAPSSATQIGLIRALLLRAGRALASREPRYAEFVSKYRHALEPNRLLVAAVADDEALRSTALDDADFRRALDLLKTFRETNPDDLGAWARALLVATRPEEADAAKAYLLGDLTKLTRSINLRLNPSSASTALDAAWTLRLTGKPDEAADVLKQFAGRGIPVPGHEPRE